MVKEYILPDFEGKYDSKTCNKLSSHCVWIYSIPMIYSYIVHPLLLVIYADVLFNDAFYCYADLYSRQWDTMME